MLDLSLVDQLQLEVLDLFVLVLDQLLLQGDGAIIQLDLLLGGFRKRLRHHASLVEAVLEDEVNQPHVGVEYRLEQDTPLNALHRHLPRHFLDGDVMGNLGQEVDLRLDQLILGLLLVREQLRLRVRSGLSRLAFEFNHLHDVFEPLR